MYSSDTSDEHELLELLLKEQGFEAPDVDIIPKRDAADTAPLSFSQQRLWFLNQLDGNSTTYNITAAFQMSGSLNHDALERSFQALIARHESFRTTFSVDDEGEAYQVIADSRSLKIEVVDSHSLSRDDVYEQIRRISAQPFDLIRGPLIRVCLFRLEERQHILLVSLHHIISDGWSLGIMVREIVAYYSAFQQGGVAEFSQLAVQYADYATWQRQWLTGDVRDKQRRYWEAQLDNLPALLELPTDNPRPAVQSHRGSVLSLQVGKDLSERVNSYSRSAGVTLFMTLLTAWAILLSRYSGQRDIAIGTPIANRTRRDVEDLIGFFVNTLVMRVDIRGDQEVSDLIKHVQMITLDAYAHQDYPFELLVDTLHPQRSLSHTPLFQVMFVLQNAPIADVDIPGLSMCLLNLPVESTKFDLSLDLVETTAGLVGRIEYSTDLFREATIARLWNHYLVLLDSMVSTPDRDVGSLPLLTDNEHHHLIDVFNSDYRTVRPDCVHHVIETQACRTPDAIAVSEGNISLTFRVINQRAECLAHRFIQLGVDRGSPVGVHLPCTPTLLIVILAIWKAGGVYVPLDPLLPEQRLKALWQNAGASCLVTTRIHPSPIVEYASQVINIDEFPFGEQNAATSLSDRVQPGDGAYVIYTSGSTGSPKGVLISHGSLYAVLQGMVTKFGFCAHDRLLSVSVMSFDISLFEYLIPLMVGGQCMLVSRDIVLETDVLVRYLQRASVLHAVPALMRILVDHVMSLSVDEQSAYSMLRLVFVGGDRVSGALLQDLGLAFPRARCIELYGPTEGTILSSAVSASRALQCMDQHIIGKPLSHARLYILDLNFQPVPIGVAGELFVGGDGVGYYYLHQSRLTVEKFIPDPYSRSPGARMYRSGDRARYLSDGNIEFLGRIDHQIKLRGFRIELGEIESALQSHPAVREVITLVREMGGDQQIVAYIVAIAVGIPVEVLRDHVKNRLPSYMVPSAFVFLQSMPLTSNGKIDRKRLPTPDNTLSMSAQCYVPPRTPVEEGIVAIWQEVLGVMQIGINGDFFDLGGHSLSATQVVARMRRTFDIDISLREFFDTSTVSRAAQCVEEKLRHTSGRSYTTIVSKKRTDMSVLSDAQKRLWFLDQLEPGISLYNIPMALRLSGLLKMDALVQGLNEIVRRHEVLRATFVVHEGNPYQKTLPPFSVPFTVQRIDTLTESQQDEELRRIILNESLRPFDLTVGPLIRATLISCSTNEHVALLTLHHIVADGWSFGVLFKELAILYSAFVNARAYSLPALPFQYADYAEWQRERFQDGLLEKQLTYWKGQVRNAPISLELPTDRPRSPVQTYRGSEHIVRLTPELTTRLKTLSREHQVTLFMTLFSAFAVLLSRHSRQQDLVIGTPIANRTSAELEELIGFFVNTLALRVDCSGNPCFHELLARVKQTTLDAYSNQDVPFERLVEEIKPERDLSRSPIVQVMFVLQNVPTAVAELPGLKLSSMSLPSGVSKFDLTLNLQESDGILHGGIEYNIDLFDHATVVRLSRHYEELLHEICARPRTRIGDLQMLSNSDIKLLHDWNATSRIYDKEICIHELIEAHAASTPSALSLAYENISLTYAELNVRANRLAHYLIQLGVGPEVLVGISLERSLEMIISILAILKAGGVYVPFDPSYPSERLKYMLDDTKIALLLTKSTLREKLPELPDKCRCIFVDDDVMQWASCAIDNPDTGIQPENLAYVIFTSGSSGRPKGTLLRHSSLSNLVHAQADAFAIHKDQRILQFASSNFDASIWEIFMALGFGASLHLASNDRLLPGPPLAETLQRYAITAITLSPSALMALTEYSAPSVDIIIVAGETCPRSLAAQLAGDYQFFNAYGPTEYTVCASIYRCIVDEERDPPIGLPIMNTQIYLLDDNLNHVPIGVKGDLYIGGHGIARGYLNRPALTADRFIPDPFCADAGQRMYKTGDIAYYRADGNIHYIGRSDTQVKIRGFRIELSEIEAALKSHHDVRDAIVLLQQAPAGYSQWIVAYVRCGSTEIDEQMLRNYLAERLPAQMVPTRCVALTSFPTMPNGKINTKAFPPIAFDSDGETYVEPRNELERKLVKIWIELLGIERVGVFDNFFELGGHSLLVASLMSHLQDQFGIRISIRTLFEKPTVAQLCNELLNQLQESENVGKSAGKSIIETLPSTLAYRDKASARDEKMSDGQSIATFSPIIITLRNGDSHSTPLFFVHAAGGAVGCYRDLTRHISMGRPIYGIQSIYMIGTVSEMYTLEKLAACYIAQIQSIQKKGPYAIAGWSVGGVIALEIARLLVAQGEKIEFLGLIDSVPPVSVDPAELSRMSVQGFAKELNVSPPSLAQDVYSVEMDDALLHNLHELAQAKNQAIAQLGYSDFHHLFYIFKHNLEMCTTHQYKSYDGVVDLLLSRETRSRKDLDTQWSDRITGKLQRHDLTGDHYSILKMPAVLELAGTLNRILADRRFLHPADIHRKRK